MTRRLIWIASLLLVGAAASAQNPAQKKTEFERLAKLIAPWPSADVMRARQVDADGRALFRSTEPLDMTIESDFAMINKDRDPESTARFPAVLKIAGAGEQLKTLSLSISARGHLRRTSKVCSFVPMRLDLPKQGIAGTVLEGPAGALKLVTHCQGSKDYEQQLLREYLAYRLSNILTPRSFRARLARTTYVDSGTGKALTTRFAVLLEDDGDVARRMGGREVSIERTQFAELDPQTLDQMMILQFMLGNTDFSITGLHNVLLIQTPTRILYPVAYDFDLSGFVNAPYAAPADILNLKSVRDRYYRGACRNEKELEPTLSLFRQKKTEMLAAVHSIPGMTEDVRSEVKVYLGEFLSMLDRPLAVRRSFIEGCKRATM